MRDIAERVGITERAAQIIVSDLEEAGYLTRTRVGRRNTYHLATGRPFRHPAESDHLVDDLIDIFRSPGRRPERERDREKVTNGASDSAR
jgi:DNA-binding Lrp family transcriptional regulator